MTIKKILVRGSYCVVILTVRELVATCWMPILLMCNSVTVWPSMCVALHMLTATHSTYSTSEVSLLSHVVVRPTCFSDHHSVSCRLHMNHDPPTVVHYQFRDTRHIHGRVPRWSGASEPGGTQGTCSPRLRVRGGKPYICTPRPGNVTRTWVIDADRHQNLGLGWLAWF